MNETSAARRIISTTLIIPITHANLSNEYKPFFGARSLQYLTASDFTLEADKTIAGVITLMSDPFNTSLQTIMDALGSL